MDATIVRDLPASAINYTTTDANRFASVSGYFQHAGSFGVAGPHSGLVGANNGGFTGAADIGGRITSGGFLQLRSNNATVLIDGTALTLTTGNWYFLQYNVERTATADTFTSSISVYNSSSAGVLGSQIDSINSNFTNAGMWADSVVFAAIRENTSIVNLDNFSLTQGTAIPEPSTFATLAGSLLFSAALILRRKRSL